MSPIENILTLSREFADARGIKLATVSSIIFNDGKRLQQLEAGSDIGVRSAEAAIQKLSDRWPPRAVWPEHIARPDPQPLTEESEEPEQTGEAA